MNFVAVKFFQGLSFSGLGFAGPFIIYLNNFYKLFNFL